MSTFISSSTATTASSSSLSSSSSSSLSPRQYQIDAALHGINENSIINIKTGGGKTLIGVIIINHYLSITYNKNDKKKILFIVPSRALVQQQADYFQKHCIIQSKSLKLSSSTTSSTSSSSNKIRIAQLCGNEIESWNKSNWNHAMNIYDIMVGSINI